MKRNNGNGLSVGPAPETGSGLLRLLSRFAFSAMVCLALAALLATVSGLEALPGALSALLVAGVLVCALLSAAGCYRRVRLLSPLLPAAALLLCLLCGEQVLNGFGAIWNAARERWAAAAGILLPLVDAEGRNGAWLTGGLLGGLLAAVGYGLSVFAPALCAILLTALAAAVCLLRVSPWLLLPVAVSILLLAAWGGSRRKDPVSPLTCGALVLLVSFVLVLAVPTESVKGLADRGMDAIHRWRYESGQELLPEGDLSQPVPEGGGDAVILEVTSDVAQTLYLRGFVGDRYEEERWSALSNEAAAQEKDLFYWLHQSGFYPQSQPALAARQMGEPETGTVRLRNLTGCSLYRYLPCTVLPETTGINGSALQPSGITTDGWRGKREYAFRTVADMQSLLPTLLEFLQTDDSAQTGAYLQAESAYRAFVRSYALEVPEAFIRQMGGLLDECCARYGGADSLTTEEAQTSALAFLERCFGEEDVALPLEDSAAGTQYQYATVAALALRYYGIPARYAEGYTVSAKAGEVTEVTAACAGAWVEVYQDGVGWLPLELTPGFEGLSGEQTEDGIKPVGVGTEGEGDGLYVSEGQTPPEEQEPQEDQPQEENPMGGQRTGLLTGAMLWLLLLLLLAVAAVVLRRCLILRRRRERFVQADRAAAIGCLFADAAALLEPLGLCREGGSMLALCGPAEERLGADYGAELREMTMLNAQALFSSRVPGEEQWERMTRFHQQTRTELLKRIRLPKKLQLKWLKCLF